MTSRSKSEGDSGSNVEELLQIGSRCRELRKEKDLLRESQSQSFQLIKSLGFFGAEKMSAVKFDIEKFDGRINFGLWQIQVKDLLIQSGLHRALKDKPTTVANNDPTSSKRDEDWEELDLRAASAIRLCLAKNVLASVHRILTAKELWEKLEGMYQVRSISNRVYLKEQFHTLHMQEGTKMSDHLSVLNGIVSELEAIGVEIEDEDKALRLIWSLPSSYEHMKPILMYGKEKVVFSEVMSKLFSEERRLSGGRNSSLEDSALVADSGTKKKRNSMKKICWACGQSGHIKRNCQRGGVGLASSSKIQAISDFDEDDEDFL